MLESFKLKADAAFRSGDACWFADRSQPSISVKRRQSILFVTSEIADYIKAGGLGEVSAALPRALRHHYDVRILIPGYRQVLSQIGPVEEIARCLHPSASRRAVWARQTQDGLTVYVLLCPELYDREWFALCRRFRHGLERQRHPLRAPRARCGRYRLRQWRCPVARRPSPSQRLAVGARFRLPGWRGQHIPTILTIHNLPIRVSSTVTACRIWVFPMPPSRSTASSSMASCPS